MILFLIFNLGTLVTIDNNFKTIIYVRNIKSNLQRR